METPSQTLQPGRKAGKRPSRMFIKYAAHLILRFALLAVGVYLLVVDPEALNPRKSFGLSQGFSFLNVVFVIMVVDALSKLFPQAKLAAGSLKQYRSLYRRIENRDATAGEARCASASDGAVSKVRCKGTYGVVDGAVMNEARCSADHGTATDLSLRKSIRRRHWREVGPVALFWILFNGLVAWGLHGAGWLNAPVAVVWSLFYFLFDMVCVVLWCPLQLVLMRNRCCTTCQIFNWDAIMSATPLLFAGGWFSWIILGLSALVFLRWEAAFVLHPEQFDDRVNAALRCGHCTDKLCYLRAPLEGRNTETHR